MVGAVLVHDDRIIGEGYHAYFGGPHAEVACLQNVQEKDKSLIAASTLYVSLEPCTHFGKTPPCADLILEQGIQRVVIGCRDPFYQVAGRGIEKLKAAGIEVSVGVLQQECEALNHLFFTYHNQHRPYIILKWAQSGDGKIAAHNRRTYISSKATNRLVHRWRSEVASILVGTNTALFDDPSLTTRLAPGANPLRLVIDRMLRLPVGLTLFNGEHKTVVFNLLQQKEYVNLTHYRLEGDKPIVAQLVKALAGMQVQSLLVEGGAYTLQAFIDAGYWDEARIITNERLFIGKGIAAPGLKDGRPVAQEAIDGDRIRYFKNPAAGTEPSLTPSL
jgi:diaminohydroxyphosphoribosylaminopyrimidine deaminase/5-amino-6-(5-phosphoribosylamino)uracil reductase